MEIIEWANGQGYTIRLSQEDATKLILLLQFKADQAVLEDTIYELEFTD